jgi:hypothetical protein
MWGQASTSLRSMEEPNREVSRHTFCWPRAARELIQLYLDSWESKEPGPTAHTSLKTLITQIAAVSGNPRGACWRFARQAGVKGKRTYRPWTKPEQQKLLDLISSHSFEEVTSLLRRSSTSVRSMLRRLGASACMGQDWFTKHALAEALHVRADEVQKWIDQGWLKCRVVGTDGLRRQLIDAKDFCNFCKQHRRQVVGNRLNIDRLNFVQTFVFPPSHAELLPVRSAKREQYAYEKQRRKELDPEECEENPLRATA